MVTEVSSSPQVPAPAGTCPSNAKPCSAAESFEFLRSEIQRRFGVPAGSLEQLAREQAGSLAASFAGRRPAAGGRECGRGATSARSGFSRSMFLSTGSAPIDALLPGGGIPAGRLTEISGRISSGKTSLVVSLVAQTQREGLRVAWIDPWAAFYAPTAERAGIALDRLLLVQPSPLSRSVAGRSSGGPRPPSDPPSPAVSGSPSSSERPPAGGTRRGARPRLGPQEGFRIADHLLRSGAFALVVMDAVGLPGRGVTAPLFRLDRRARHYGTALVLITDHPERSQSLGPSIALRLCIERRSYCFEPVPSPPFGLTGYRIEVEVGKVKGGSVQATMPRAASSQVLEVRHPDGIAR